ncbi:MAG: hypothetical protein IT544_04825 [Rhodobacteraceae bacterium]|nr:hypothetical protein [Paracoccaceae bacterium]
MRTAAEFMEAMQHVMAAPKDAAEVLQLCFRPAYNKRWFPDRLELTRAQGVLGDRWTTAPWLKLPNGKGDPRIQVSILPKRVLDLVWREGDSAAHPGDTIIADLDTSEANLPEGTLLACGTAVLRVSSIFNSGCVKWKARYGKAAKDWITVPDHRPLRLRGVLCAVERDGVVMVADVLRKL